MSSISFKYRNSGGSRHSFVFFIVKSKLKVYYLGRLLVPICALLSMSLLYLYYKIFTVGLMHKTKWCCSLVIKRCGERILIGLLTGHITLNRHLTFIKMLYVTCVYGGRKNLISRFGQVPCHSASTRFPLQSSSQIVTTNKPTPHCQCFKNAPENFWGNWLINFAWKVPSKMVLCVQGTEYVTVVVVCIVIIQSIINHHHHHHHHYHQLLTKLLPTYMDASWRSPYINITQYTPW